MSIFDVILLLLLFGFVYGGFFNGLIKSLGSILGIVIGAWAASHFYILMFSKIGNWFGPFDNLGKVVCFILVFLIAAAMVGFLVKVIDRAYDLMSFIPFLKTINRFAGAFLGFLQGALIISLVLFVLAKYSPVDSFIGGLLVSSRLTPIFLDITRILFPFLSSAIKNLSSIV